MEQMKLSDIMKEMNKIGEDGLPVLFDLEVWSFNKQNGSGGRLNKYRNVRLLIPNRKKNLIKDLKSNTIRKNPNHKINRTRNIKLLNGKKVSFHPMFIHKFNNKKMHY